MEQFIFHQLDYFQFILWFFIYSFFGWAMECVVIRKQKGYWENRGFARLPFCVIYGFGVTIAMYLFSPIEHNYLALYVFGAVGATCLEYLVAQVMMWLFGEVWWNYDHLPFNYKGILCLESTLAWGLLALFIFGFMNARIEMLVVSMNHGLVKLIGSVLLFSYLTDFTYHFIKRYQANRNSMNDGQEIENISNIENIETDKLDKECYGRDI